MLTSGWGVVKTQYFLDDKGALREIDGRSFIQTHWENANSQRSLFSNLVIECKKSTENPWVFFKTFGLPSLNIPDNIGNIQKTFMVDFRKENNAHHYFTMKNIAKQYLIPFCNTNNNKKLQIYNAIDKLITYYEYSNHRKLALKSKQHKNTSISVCYLSIVLEGQLFLADVLKNNIRIEKANHIVIYVPMSIPLKQKYYSIDIVTKFYFGKYLEILKKDHSIIKRYLKDKNF